MSFLRHLIARHGVNIAHEEQAIISAIEAFTSLDRAVVERGVVLLTVIIVTSLAVAFLGNNGAERSACELQVLAAIAIGVRSEDATVVSGLSAAGNGVAGAGA